MKATGIVRRIDDLGRVVIPKEIRRTLRIRESKPLEIFTKRKNLIQHSTIRDSIRSNLYDYSIFRNFNFFFTTKRNK